MYIADLHIHSRFSRATSKEGDAPHLDLWAGRKGIGLVGTGDFTHPAWREELQEMLTPAEEGFYTLKPQYRLASDTAGAAQPPRFVLTGEISSIYKKNGRVRKVHNLILLPSLQAAEELSRRLERVGNIHSDGRPILGLDSRDLLELTLTACPEAVFIPAHIWTPHFSLFGAFSGFQTMEECFEDLTPHIHAVETGLSSDPPMNWQVSALDSYTLVSNSDAHSPQKLGREANLLDCGLSYPALKHAMETGEGFGGTIEFFPEEGKYHLDGHRNCGVCLTPQEAESLGGLCPVCGKKLTIGVQHRVEELADRPLGQPRPHQKPFESLAPLPEVIAACTGNSETSKKTQARYQAMLQQLGSEFHILRQAGFEDIQRVAGPAVAEGIRRLRLGQVERVPGYDGAFGHVVLLTPAEREALEGQTSLFGAAKAKAPKRGRPAAPKQSSPKKEQGPSQPTAQLNPEQRRPLLAFNHIHFQIHDVGYHLFPEQAFCPASADFRPFNLNSKISRHFQRIPQSEYNTFQYCLRHLFSRRVHRHPCKCCPCHRVIVRGTLSHEIRKIEHLIFSQLYDLFLLFCKLRCSKNILHPPFITGCCAEHAAHQMIVSIRMGKGVKRIIPVYLELPAGNKDGTARSEGNIAHSLADSSGSHSRSRIIPGSRNDFYAFRQSEFFSLLLFQSADHLIAFIKIRQLLPADSADFHHLFGPALVLHIHQKHTGRIRIVAAKRPGQPVRKVIFRKHDFPDPRKLLRLIFFHPENFRRCKSRKRNVGRICRQLFPSDHFI